MTLVQAQVNPAYGGAGGNHNYFRRSDPGEAKALAQSVSQEIPGSTIVEIPSDDGGPPGYSIWVDPAKAKEQAEEMGARTRSSDSEGVDPQARFEKRFQGRNFCQNHEGRIGRLVGSFPELKSKFENDYEVLKVQGRYDEAADMLRTLEMQVPGYKDEYAKAQAPTVLAPTGADTGQKVYVLRTFNPEINPTRATRGGEEDPDAPLIDELLADQSNSYSKEEIAELRARGYTVVIDDNAQKHEVESAFYDPQTAGVVFQGHGTSGEDGQPAGEFTTFYNDRVGPSDLDPEKVSPNLRMIHSIACKSGQQEAGWEKVAPQAEFYGSEVNNDLQQVPDMYGEQAVPTQDSRFGSQTMERTLQGAMDEHLPSGGVKPKSEEVLPFRIFDI